MKYLDFSGLSHFWEKAKAYIATAISTAVSELKSGLKLEDITDVTVTAAEVNHLDGVKSNVQEQIDAKAPLASPALTGTPTAPTAQAGTNTQQIATTEFVKKAIDAIPEVDLTGYVNDAEYDKSAKKIILKNDEATIAEIDATDFIKDGMVDNVEVKGEKLVITFNTDSGREAIEIGISKIFNADNYYDKTAADAKFATKTELEEYVKEEDIETISDTEIDGLFA